MTATSLDYILNPIYISIEFALGEDFMYKNKRNYAYFFINLIISLIISFFSLVYNEFLILYIYINKYQIDLLWMKILFI